MDETLVAEACELFRGGRREALEARVLARVRSPYEIPYAFLDEDSPLRLAVMPEDGVVPTGRHVELAYRLILQRVPESEDVVRHHLERRESMAALLKQFLLGGEYRTRAAVLLNTCTLEVPRVWHIHVPKTAGTSFRHAFEEAGWAVSSATDLADPAFGIGDFARRVNLSRLRAGALFTGHQDLASVVPLMLPFDACVAFVRHPLDRAISWFNYMLQRFGEDPARDAADTRDFFARGFDPESFERTYAYGRILIPNEQCAHLAQDAKAATALGNARRMRCRLFDHRRVPEVIEEILGVSAAPRRNASRPVLRRADLSEPLIARILSDNAEDLALYEAVQRA